MSGVQPEDRRVQLWLEQQGIPRNPKTVLRIMRKYGLLSEIRRRKKYRVMEQQLHRPAAQSKVGNRHIEGVIFFYSPASTFVEPWA